MPRPPRSNVVLGIPEDPQVERIGAEPLDPSIEALLAQAAGPSAPIEQPPVVQMPLPAPAAPEGWEAMDAYVQDGRPAWLTSASGQVVKAIWRETRAWDQPNGRWRPVAFWSVFNGGGNLIVPFEPVGWKPVGTDAWA